jgi:glycosyltransferase involved in cell wall biosynthesis
MKRSFDSLEMQTNTNFKVILVDYGSEPEMSNGVKKLLENYPFITYIYNNTRGMPWNRAHSLNTGIRIAETEFVFTADIDMIFKNNFVEKLIASAVHATVTFFQVYYLPQKFSNWENIGSQKYETSKKFALGLALLPVKTINEIGGYDEFYCFWGLEDNDLEHRLKKAGIKTNFFDEEVLMYHQWHLPGIASEKEFPQAWGVFQNDYFLSRESVVKRNELTGWGKLYSENERPALAYIHHPGAKFNLHTGSAAFFIYDLISQFRRVAPGNMVAFEFNDVKSEIHKNSRLGKTISFFQKKADALKVPMNLVSKFRNLYATVYEVRDEAIIFILSNKEVISDYCFLTEEKKIRLVILKK